MKNTKFVLKILAVVLCMNSLTGCDGTGTESGGASSDETEPSAGQLVTNQDCIDIIKEYENVRLQAYQGPSGAWLIGYGHKDGVSAGMEITTQKAEKLLRDDLVYYEKQVANRVKSPLNVNQFSALVCLTYNIGEGNFGKSTLLKEINNGDYNKAAEAILMWNKANGAVNDHQVKRRTTERELFLK